MKEDSKKNKINTINNKTKNIQKKKQTNSTNKNAKIKNTNTKKQTNSSINKNKTKNTNIKKQINSSSNRVKTKNTSEKRQSHSLSKNIKNTDNIKNNNIDEQEVNIKNNVDEKTIKVDTKNTEFIVKRRLKKKFVVLLLIIFLFIFAFSLYKVITWAIDNIKTKNQINDIHESIKVEEVEEVGEVENIVETITEVNPPIEEESDYWYYIKMPLINVDFTELLEKNKDTIGWIKVNGTNINYPIVQTDDNDYYLTHSFDKKYNDAGWIYMDFRNDIDNLSKNNIIYGHSRLDKTMFGSLKNITKSNWYKNKDNYIIKLSTPNKNTMWQVFSVYRIPNESYYITTDFNNDDEYQLFIDTISKRSVYEFNAMPNINDKILTLSTCGDNDTRVVMHAKLIKESVRN